MKVPSTSLPQHTSCASLVSVEKKSCQILFEQATYVNFPVHFCQQVQQHGDAEPLLYISWMLFMSLFLMYA